MQTSSHAAGTNSAANAQGTDVDTVTTTTTTTTVGDKRKHCGEATTKVPRKRGRRSKKEIEEAAAGAAAATLATGLSRDLSSSSSSQKSSSTIETEADALAARRAHQKTLSLNSLYGDAAKPDTREFMHVNMGHALMRRDDVFYLHPLSEQCLIQRGSIPCPDPSRATVYRNTLDIRASGPCMHCDRECTAGRVPLPRAYDTRTRAYAVWGNFCSFPCVMAYQLEHGSGVYDTPHVLVLIHKMATEVWGREGLVSPAPPRFCLRKFGGAVDPQDIELLSERQYHAVVEAPFISWGMMVECKTVDVVGRALKRLIAPVSGAPARGGTNDGMAAASAPLSVESPLHIDPNEHHQRSNPVSGGCGMSVVDAPSGSIGCLPDKDGAADVRSAESIQVTGEDRSLGDGDDPFEEKDESEDRPIDLCVLADQEDDLTESESFERIARAFNVRGLPPHDPHMEHPGALCRAGGVDGISASAGRRDAERRAQRGISLLGTTRAAPSGMPSYSAPVPADTVSSVADEADPEAIGGSRWERFLQSRATAAGVAPPSDAVALAAATPPTTTTPQEAAAPTDSCPSPIET
jgi:hypothetical protein